MPKPSLRSILPDYLLGIGLGVAAGCLSQAYVATEDSIFLAFAVMFGAFSVLVLGKILRELL